MTDQETGAPPPDPNDPAQTSVAPTAGETPESDQQENDPRGDAIEGGSASTQAEPQESVKEENDDNDDDDSE